MKTNKTKSLIKFSFMSVLCYLLDFYFIDTPSRHIKLFTHVDLNCDSNIPSNVLNTCLSKMRYHNLLWATKILAFPTLVFHQVCCMAKSIVCFIVQCQN